MEFDFLSPGAVVISLVALSFLAGAIFGYALRSHVGWRRRQHADDPFDLGRPLEPPSRAGMPELIPLVPHLDVEGAQGQRSALTSIDPITLR
jgi:hypothetical protein